MSALKTLMTLLLIMSAALALRYLVRPEWERVNMARGELATVNETLEQTRGLIRLYDDINAQYQQISPEEIKHITEFLPPKPDIGDLLIDVDTLVTNSGMELAEIQFQEGVRSSIPTQTPGAAGAPDIANIGSLIESIGFSVKVKGSYEAFQVLLESIENNLRLVDIGKISFTAADETKEYVFSVEAKTYYQTKSAF